MMFYSTLFLTAFTIGIGLWAAEAIARWEVKQPAPYDGKQADMSKPVKIFIFMGQSNMLGFGLVPGMDVKGSLGYYCKKEKKYPFLLDQQGNWVLRKDVRCVLWITANSGPAKVDWLQPGFGARPQFIGPELGFGYVVGNAVEAPVLLIKACIGNRSLGWDYLPPGSQRFASVRKDRSGVEKTFVYAGYKDRPPFWEMDKAQGLATPPPPWLGKDGKPIDWYAGKQYDDDVAKAKAVLADIGKYYPGADSYEIAGFVWFQGHKDQDPVYASRYEQNLANLIKALRKEFNAPKVPFVLATGCGNPGTEGFGLKIADAQLAMNDANKYPEFAGNVTCVDARGFWPKPEESPSKQGYHYYWNAATYMDVGLSLGWAMVELLNKERANIERGKNE